jgi:hypothetical protein
VPERSNAERGGFRHKPEQEISNKFLNQEGCAPFTTEEHGQVATGRLTLLLRQPLPKARGRKIQPRTDWQVSGFLDALVSLTIEPNERGKGTWKIGSVCWGNLSITAL